MIIAQRSANLSYGTDPVAQSVRSLTSASAARFGLYSQAQTSVAAALDMPRLYPAVFACAPKPSKFVRACRAAAFRLSVVGTAAVTMLVLFHH